MAATAAAAALSLARPLHCHPRRPGRHKPCRPARARFPLPCRSQLLSSPPEEEDGGGERSKKREETTTAATGEKDVEMKGRRRRAVIGGILAEAEKVGRGLKEGLSPRRKGDWKDVLLMSLSFAVYVYMSQKLVCAYCAWMAMLHNSFS